MTSNILTRLADLAEVQLGRAFKTAVEDLGESGDVSLIQIGDLNAGNADKPHLLPSVKLEDSDYKYLVEPGDILLPLRGANIRAYIHELTTHKPIITSNQVAIIKCKEHLSNPYFLCWYLNTPEVAHYIMKTNEGSNIQKLSGSLVRGLLINTPSIDIQHNIAAVYKNWLAQKAIHLKLIENGDVLYQGACKQMLNGTVSIEYLI
jgi:restriction endonuclease S subunit